MSFWISEIHLWCPELSFDPNFIHSIKRAKYSQSTPWQYCWNIRSLPVQWCSKKGGQSLLAMCHIKVYEFSWKRRSLCQLTYVLRAGPIRETWKRRLDKYLKMDIGFWCCYPCNSRVNDILSKCRSSLASLVSRRPSAVSTASTLPRIEITSASEVPPLEAGYYFITSTSRKVSTVSEDLTRFQESDIGTPQAKPRAYSLS